MATKTSNYEFNKPEQNDFYDVDVQNENWDKVDEELSEFDDSGVTEDIKSFPDFLSKFVTGNKVAITLRNLKAGLQFVLHAGQIVNNCVTDNAGLPLSAAQGKALMDKYTQLYSDLNTTNNNLSKCLQYIHSETDVFDFNDPKTPAGYHRLGAAASYKNAPSGLDGVNFCTVEIVRPTISDTLAMTIYPYKKGINPPVWYKSGGSNEWSTLPWNVYATKSDLNSALIYRGDITGDLNRASKNGITPGYYTVGNSSTISNGPKGIAWCPFIQFYDNFHTQMIIDTTGLFVRKFAGNPAAWIDWAQYSKS